MFLAAPLIAYSQTGKDSFVKDLQQNKLAIHQESDEAKWIVYALPETETKDFQQIVASCNASRITRYAYADALKTFTHNYLRFQNCSVDTFEQHKDTLFVRDPEDPRVSKTIRKWYIDIGREERSKNPLVWAEITNKEIENEQLIKKVIPMNTDFRYPNELMDRNLLDVDGNRVLFSKEDLTTIRLHRKDVKVAPMCEDSEHALDSFTSKYLLIPPGPEEYTCVMERFPQYQGFVRRFILVLTI